MLSRPPSRYYTHTFLSQKTQLDHSLLSLCNAFFFVFPSNRSPVLYVCLCSVEGLSFLMTSLRNFFFLCLNLCGVSSIHPFSPDPKSLQLHFTASFRRIIMCTVALVLYRMSLSTHLINLFLIPLSVRGFSFYQTYL
jgi:hypothetical protein